MIFRFPGVWFSALFFLRYARYAISQRYEAIWKNILRWIHFSSAETFVAEFPKKVSMALILIHNLKHWNSTCSFLIILTSHHRLWQFIEPSHSLGFVHITFSIFEKTTSTKINGFFQETLASPVRLGTPPTGHPGLTNFMAGTTIPRDVAPAAPAAPTLTATASQSVALGGESVTNSLSLAGEVWEKVKRRTPWNWGWWGCFCYVNGKNPQLFLSIPFGEGKDRVDLVEKCEGGCVLFLWGEEWFWKW